MLHSCTRAFQSSKPLLIVGLPLVVPSQEEHERGGCVGLDVASGEPSDPHLSGVLDNYIVKRQILQRWATGLLLMLGTCVVWRCPLL